MGVFGVDRFTKILFVEPESYGIHGRMVLNFPFGDRLYPMYFRVEPRRLRIPATGEMSEMEMSFLRRQETTRLTDCLPEKWPLPKDPRFPFHGGLTEYLRPIGPGCYIGVGWREPRLEFQDMGRQFLTFLLIKNHLS